MTPHIEWLSRERGTGKNEGVQHVHAVRGRQNSALTGTMRSTSALWATIVEPVPNSTPENTATLQETDVASSLTSTAC